jgi:Ca-activated chloride channel homolog
MKLPTLLALGAAGMAATSVVVWNAVEPAHGRTADLAREAEDATAPAAADPPPTPTADRAQFQAGRTLMMEGRLGHRTLPADTDSETFLFVDVSADAAGRARTEVPLNLAIVLDRSGSMKGKRLDNAMAAARSAIQRLRDGDIVSVVTYNTAAEALIDPTVIDATSRARVLKALERPRAGGDTCISCGIDAGMRLLGQRSGMVSRILLLSDGLATAGVRDLRGFRRIAEDCRRMGAAITTIGVDLDYDEKVMAALARDSNGRHFFASSPTALPPIFDQEMDALTRTVARDAELTVDLAPGVFVEHVYDRVSVGSGTQVVAPLGAFTAGERKTLLVRLRVPRGAAGERPVAAVRLRYADLAEAKDGTCDGELATVMTTDPSQLTPLDALVSARVSSSETAEALEQANLLAREGRRAEATALIQRNASRVDRREQDAKQWAPKGREKDLDAAFAKQKNVLRGASTGFGESASAAEPAAQVRANQADAFDLSN